LSVSIRQPTFCQSAKIVGVSLQLRGSWSDRIYLLVIGAERAGLIECRS
jgi:hypothetical protein